MKREWIKSTLAFLMFLAVLLTTGFFNFNIERFSSNPELALNETERVDLPFDLKRFPNSVLRCKAKNNQITVATLKAAAELKVGKKTVIEKILEKQHITGKQGVINLPAHCFIKAEGLTIKKDDILIGEGFLQDTPSLVNENQNNTLIIYNTSFNDTEFKVESFLEDGTKAFEKNFKVKSFSFKTLKTKENTAKTYRIIPQSKGANYLAINRETISGKVYISKPLRTFSNAIISPKKGVLVVSNVTSAPATFRYIVTKNGKKRYEGKEWLLPYSQRKISLAKLKSLKNAKMEITPISYYYPKVCNEDGKCYRDESRKDSTIVANYYNGKTFNAITNTEEAFSDEIRYKNKVNKALPVSCKIDNVAKPYCDKDNNKNGIDDAEELFHFFANPELADADEDGFSNAEEIREGTKAFHPFDFPGAPKDDTVEGMYQLSKLIEGTSVHKVKLNQYKGSTKVDNSNFFGEAVLKSNSQIESLIESFAYQDSHNLIDAVCRGIKICINDSPYANEVAAYIDGCLNVMSQVVGSVAGDGCRYCKVDIDINGPFEKCGESDLVIDFDSTRLSHYKPGSRSIHFNPQDLSPDFLSNPSLMKASEEELRKMRRYTICHELGHAFYSANDRYADMSFNIPSLYAGNGVFNTKLISSCMTSYDMYILQLSTIRRMTGKPISEIVAQTISCITKDGKMGKQIVGFSNECLEDWTTPEYRHHPRLYCPPDGQDGEKENYPIVSSEFKPECHCTKIEVDEDSSICCEDSNAINCAGDCCSGVCTNGKCNKQSKCENNEVYDPKKDRCCPRTEALNITEDGYGSCCDLSLGRKTIACGDSCCLRESCLETSEGAYCCDLSKPFACPGAIGSDNGCCERGCLVDKSNYSNSMCKCDLNQRIVSVTNALNGYKTYVRCEECQGTIACDEQCCAGDEICVFENREKKCKKCPDGQEREQNKCICSETKFDTCGGECCSKDQICNPEKKECENCKEDKKPCYDKCCEKDEICEIIELFDSKVGSCSLDLSSPMVSDSPIFDVFSPSPSLTPDFSPTESEELCPIGDDCIQDYPDRQCCGTVSDASLSMRNDNRCTEFGNGGVCYCCSNIKEDPNHCDTKCMM